jgi:hypothetical protein
MSSNSLDYRPPPRENAIQNHDHGDDEKNVNQPACDVEDEAAEQPENEED